MKFFKKEKMIQVLDTGKKEDKGLKKDNDGK